MVGKGDGADNRRSTFFGSFEEEKFLVPFANASSRLQDKDNNLKACPLL